MSDRTIFFALAEVMARATMAQRLEAFAQEAENLSLLGDSDPLVADVVFAVEMGEYQNAIQKARGDWEPPEPDPAP